MAARSSQNSRWVHRRKDHFSQFRLVWQPPAFEHAEHPAEERLRGGCAETDDDARPNELDFRLEPGKARANLGGVRRLMNATFAARVLCPLEVLHGIRDVDVLARDACGVEGAIEQLARRSDERPSCFILGVAWLFANDDHPCAARAFAEDGLGAELVEMAAATSLSRGPQLWKRRARRDEISG